MKSKAIPNFFFYDGKLHKRIEVLVSDDTVIAFSYQDEKRMSYPRRHLRSNYKKAYSIGKAAKIMNISPGTVREIIKKKLVPMPEQSYDDNYNPGRMYISESDMIELRQVAWDQIPKNKYGIPTKDTIVSETELIHIMNLSDEREFIRRGSDEVIKIFREEDYEI